MLWRRRQVRLQTNNIKISEKKRIENKSGPGHRGKDAKQRSMLPFIDKGNEQWSGLVEEIPDLCAPIFSEVNCAPNVISGNVYRLAGANICRCGFSQLLSPCFDET